MEIEHDARLLIARLQNRDPYTPDLNSVLGCEVLAQLLFTLIRKKHGEKQARRIFLMFGREPPARRVAQIENLGLLDRLDMMRPKPNVQKLARELAKENKRLPKSKRRGAGSTDPTRLERQIRRVKEARAVAMRKGTWRGPFPEDVPPGHQS